MSALKRIIKSSRVQIALATIVGAVFAEVGFDVSETTILASIGLVAIVVGGTSIEDAAHKFGLAKIDR